VGRRRGRQGRTGWRGGSGWSVCATTDRTHRRLIALPCLPPALHPPARLRITGPIVQWCCSEREEWERRASVCDMCRIHSHPTRCVGSGEEGGGLRRRRDDTTRHATRPPGADAAVTATRAGLAAVTATAAALLFLRSLPWLTERWPCVAPIAVAARASGVDHSGHVSGQASQRRQAIRQAHDLGHGGTGKISCAGYDDTHSAVQCSEDGSAGIGSVGGQATGRSATPGAVGRFSHHR